MKNIHTNTLSNLFYEVEKGSNYKVTLTYDKTEIITFEQFTRLIDAIFKGSGDFVTVNKIIVQKKDIRMIEPTTELTAKQKQEQEARNLKQNKKTKRLEELERIKKFYEIKYFNDKYGENNWYRYSINAEDGKHIITQKDMEQVWKEFQKVYPDEAKEMLDLLHAKNL